ncbi:hypothetical protein BCR36DRAFT_371431 [Piromyces finnis]|uniref:Uncharacterized protein n=1 Tax=Piromyces finnis TaxID=1754191 RepID=A0A1Y1V6A0_9FUNG|nr:hypothetical protein BCR36DRAFT_371431 [Piromyces finnis]|eukprot:ORX48179.1 hypothetical protein BCR36DRAFT_371431 [Piromyces finnis]
MPEISRNQKYSDCWRDYIYDMEKEIKSDKGHKKNKNEKQIKDKIYHEKMHKSDSIKDNHKHHNNKYLLNDKRDEDKYRHSEKGKRCRENKYKDNSIIKKIKIEDKMLESKSKTNTKSHRYEESTRRRSRSRNRSKSKSRNGHYHSHSHSHHYHHNSYDKHHK